MNIFIYFLYKSGYNMVTLYIMYINIFLKLHFGYNLDVNLVTL